MVAAFVQNLGLPLALMPLYGLLLQRRERWAPWTWQVVVGLSFGLWTWMCMFLPVTVAPGIIVDNRVPVVAVAAAFVGPLPGFLAAVMAAGMRIQVGGVGVVPGCISIASAYLAGLMAWRWGGLATSGWPRLRALGLGLVCAAVTLPWTLLLPAPLEPLRILIQMAPGVVLIYPLGTMVLVGLLSQAERHQRTAMAHVSSERRLRALFEDAPEAIILGDPLSGHVVEANREALRLLELPAASVIGRPLTSLHPPGCDPWRRPIDSSWAASRAAERYLLLLPDGNSIPVEACTCRITGVDGRQQLVGFFRDLRAEERSSRALAAAQDLTSRIVAVADMLILGIDQRDRVVFANPAMAALCGHSSDALVGQDARSLILGADDGVWPAEGRCEADLLGADGQRRHIAWSFSRPGQGTDGLALVAMGLDLTHQRAAEERLRQSERLQAIGMLAGGVAHDFNNQLQIIGASAEAIGRRSGEGELRELVESLRYGVQRAAELTGQLLAFSRRGGGHRQSIHLHVLLEELSTLLRRSFDRSYTIELHLEATAPLLHADAGAVQNAVLNLCINARDAMPGGGVLRIQTNDGGDLREGERLAGGFTAVAGSCVTIRIIDQGSGIPEHLQDRIFEPFFTTKGVGQGTGLGLAAVHGTAHELGGSLALSSRVGQGSTFVLCLPTTMEEAKTTLRRETTPSAGSARVLLVDDEPLIVELACEILQESGWTVLAHTDPHAALGRFQEDPGGIDLALIDLNMPGLGGVELAHSLLALRPRLPVVIATGFGPQALDDALRNHPGVSVLRKPYGLDELVAHLAERLPRR
jgi:hypothetical protein